MASRSCHVVRLAALGVENVPDRSCCCAFFIDVGLEIISTQLPPDLLSSPECFGAHSSPLFCACHRHMHRSTEGRCFLLDMLKILEPLHCVFCRDFSTGRIRRKLNLMEDSGASSASSASSSSPQQVRPRCASIGGTCSDVALTFYSCAL